MNEFQVEALVEAGELPSAEEMAEEMAPFDAAAPSLEEVDARLAAAYANGDLLTGSDDFLRSIGKEASNALGLLCDRDACVANGTAGGHLVHPAEGWI